MGGEEKGRKEEEKSREKDRVEATQPKNCRG
jgi:hypothetical protein